MEGDLLSVSVKCIRGKYGGSVQCTADKEPALKMIEKARSSLDEFERQVKRNIGNVNIPFDENKKNNYEKLRELFIEYVSKAQDGFQTGRRELSILYDYEEITGRDFVKDREEFRGNKNA